VNGNSLLASLLVGSIGFGLFVYGKKQKRTPHLIVGIAMMVYPYLVPNVAIMLVIAGVVLGLLFLATRMGI
jgi:hypothetical protein